MRQIRVAFMGVLFAGLVGCGFLDSQLSRPADGGDSKLEQEVKAVAPVAGPWGSLALAAATLITGVYGAFHAREANKQTDEPKA
jgi:hypothetical protein